MVFMRIFALNTEVTCFLGQLNLSFALLLDSGVCNFDGVNHLVFAHLTHFTLHHHNAVHAACHHDIHIGTLQF